MSFLTANIEKSAHTAVSSAINIQGTPIAPGSETIRPALSGS